VIDPAARVHATAEVASDAAIGPDAAIWDRAVVRAGARVGAGATIGRDVLVDEGVEIGQNAKVHSGALLYRGVVVGDAVYIGPRAILTNDRYPRAVLGDGTPARGDAAEAGGIRIDHAASIGAGAIVMPGCTIGRFATVGAGAVVTRSVTPHALVAGNPAHRIGWVCSCGARLRDAAGNPAPADVERYAIDPYLACPGCARRFVYVPDGDALEERRGPAVGAGTAGSGS
jgi:UDP-2-acetamido-3-amino-2,3-dideoxy-glucuronate N-acetyltransferase